MGSCCQHTTHDTMFWGFYLQSKPLWATVTQVAAQIVNLSVTVYLDCITALTSSTDNMTCNLFTLWVSVYRMKCLLS